MVTCMDIEAKDGRRNRLSGECNAATGTSHADAGQEQEPRSIVASVGVAELSF